MLGEATLLVGATLILAYSNGANDNFKGVATLYGSGTTGFSRALGWATVTTLAGSLTALWFGSELIKNFSGKGLVPPDTASNSAFLIAVGVGAASTVLLATRLGLPVSTTHSIIGALIGAGFVAVGSELNVAKLGGTFLIPLLVSPALAAVLAMIVYLPLRHLRRRFGITEDTCLCVGPAAELVPITAATAESLPPGQTIPLTASICQSLPVEVRVGTEAHCVRRYSGSFLGLNAAAVVDWVHYASAGAVSFARGLNDTPKIVALLLAANLFDIRFGLASVAAAIAIGGLLSARRVAHTMSRRITEMNAGQGLSANLVTALLVLFASRFGMPVSTTHVSCGALFGIGTVSRTAHARTIASILLAWVIVLPLAALTSAAALIIARAILHL